MPFLPVAAREARGAARSVRIYAWRSAIAAIGIALVPATLWWSRGGGMEGPHVFFALSTMAFLYCLVGGVLRTADTLAEERRENTLGLLFLTDLKVHDVVTGKLLSSTASVILGLLAILPLLAIPILMGGISKLQWIAVMANLVNTLFLSIAIGFLVSSIFRESWATITFGLFAVLWIAIGIPMVANPAATSVTDPFSFTLLLFSPGFAHGVAIEGSLGRDSIFWQTLVVNHLAAWLCILYTAHFLPRAWQETPRSARADAWWRKMRKIRFGGNVTRVKFRRRLLNSNPLYWLSGREQVSSGGLMAVLMLIVFFSLVGEWMGILIGLIALHFVLLTRMASAASHALAEDRKSGALELLLATSLTVPELLAGRWMGFRRQFFGPVLIVTCWHFFTVAWMVMLESRSQYLELYLVTGAGWAVAILSWVATGWCGMWLGLRGRHPLAAMSYTLFAVVIAPWFVMIVGFSGLVSLGVAGSQSPEDNVSRIAGALILWGFYLSMLATWAANRIRTHFRTAAADRFLSGPTVDWVRMRRACLIFIGTVLAMAAMIIGYRMVTDYAGERALENALAAHPEFSLQTPGSPMVSPGENLARWDFLYEANRNAFSPFAFSRGPVGFDQSITTGFADDPGLNAWRKGRTLEIKSNTTMTPRERAVALLKRFDGFDITISRLLLAARERPYIQFTLNAPNAQSGAWQIANVWANNTVPALVQFLARRACCRIEIEQNPLDEILLAVRLSASLTNAPNGPELWERCFAISAQPIYDGILANRWSASDLAAIQKQLEAVDAVAIYDPWRHNAIREALLLAHRKTISRNGVAQEESSGKAKSRQAKIIRFGLETLSTNLDSKRRIIFPSSSDRAAQGTEQLIADLGIQADAVLKYIARIQTTADEITLSCALERFRLAKDYLPSKLDELVPDYLAKIPTDIVTGKPLKYRPEPDGKSYVLYAVGFDELDDGGKLETMGRGDWPWIIRR